MSPVPTGQPAPGELLPPVRDPAGAAVHELRDPAAGRGEVLLRMRDARQRARLSSARCAVGSWGGPRPGLAGYVTVTGPKPGAPAAGGRLCCLSSDASTPALAPARATQALPRAPDRRPRRRAIGLEEVEEGHAGMAHGEALVRGECGCEGGIRPRTIGEEPIHAELDLLGGDGEAVDSGSP